jgi:hypothetical protein
MGLLGLTVYCAYKVFLILRSRVFLYIYKSRQKNMITRLIFTAIAIYLAGGFIFSIAFITRGVDKIDEAAHGASLGFRIIIIPGTMLLWPVLLKKWLKSTNANHHD